MKNACPKKYKSTKQACIFFFKPCKKIYWALILILLWHAKTSFRHASSFFRHAVPGHPKFQLSRFNTGQKVETIALEMAFSFTLMNSLSRFACELV
jgi:hypothetical protein